MAGVTEDEAALYDRQIRLWGLEAQNKMRSAHVVVVCFSGVATEVIKNIVLSGIGSLTIVDSELVRPDDLGAGFFFRDTDISRKRIAEAPLARVQALNPLVKVRGAEHSAVASSDACKMLQADVLVACAGTRAELETLNTHCRAHNTMFYATQAQGMGGFIFSDLGPHYTYALELPMPGKQEKQRFRYTQSFVTLHDSLRTTWSKSPREDEIVGQPVRRISAGLWATWALWELQSRKEPVLSVEDFATKLETLATDLMRAKNVQVETLARQVDMPHFFATFARAMYTHVSENSVAGFAPVTAVLGGLLAQDLLNALGHTQVPMVNWCILDASSGTAPIHAIGTLPATKEA
ncbi:E1 ubiquitin-activating enzyme [Malassezia vespertilionis]|uniref:Ubiquitin-like 1-activating enzyme E1A n=1 Tax=Malassezia vespertilionis TaxID=2020962 RepID=A0A2N1J8D4_9BASI|nr:E1 ubiquitin-activating enzyme [Malassezia vespertilionis]PKI82809.1 hypothetical protein MVES_003235 [Malassezia vespertilionis]WFD08301.1 E1 ubiquitin-activating enzyme [Malassezia vespertilionis]